MTRIGEAVARIFAEKGARGVVICGRNEQLGEKVARDIHAKHPQCETLFVRADLADAEQTQVPSRKEANHDEGPRIWHSAFCFPL